MIAWVIARLTFREAARRKILWAALLIGLAFLTIYAIGFHLIRQEYLNSARNASSLVLNQISNFFLMAGLYAVNFLTIMMTVLTSVDTISGEINSGTIHTLVSKPIVRRDILLGKWLGYTGLVSLYLLFMAGGVTVIVFLIAQYFPLNFGMGLALIWLNAILILSLSLLGGTYFSTVTNGVLVLGLFGIAFIGGWIEQFGALIRNQTAVNVGVISSLILPSEALWKLAADTMQPVSSGMLRGMTPFSPASVPSTLMVVYAVVYAMAAFFLAMRKFNLRDL